MTAASRTIQRDTPAIALGSDQASAASLSHDHAATLAACSAYPTLVLTLAYTGLRVGGATGCAFGVRRRFVIEEIALMIAYKIPVGTPKPHEKRSMPHFARLDLMIEHAFDSKAPEGLRLGDCINHIRNSGARGWSANAVRGAQATDPPIPRLTPHDLRRAAASLGISSGVT